MSRRILLLITDLQIGGMPTVARELAIRLRGNVEVACLASWGPVASQIEEAGISVTALGATGPKDLRVIYRLVQLIHDRKIDAVLSILVHANTVAAIASWFCPGVQFIQSIHTTQPNPKWHWTVQGLAQHFTETLFVPSSSVAKALRDRSGVPDEKLRIIPYGLDFSTLSRKRQISSNVTTIGFIGRLDPVKRIPDLVQAISLLDERFSLHIFGEGAERPRIEREIERLNLRRRVTLHGAIPRPGPALEMMDLLVLPSEAEGFGLVLIEAMAVGVPVVATNVPGIWDVVRDEVTGLLVPVAQPVELARAIKRIAASDSLRQRLVEAAAVDVRRRYDWSVVLPQYRRLLGWD